MRTGPLGPPGPPGRGLGRPGFTSTTLDDSSILGYSSVAIGADGLPLISYAAFHQLKVAHCENLDCTSAATVLLKSCQCEPFTSVAIGADGLGLIAYTGSSVGFLEVAHCVDTACSSVTTATIGEPDHFAFDEVSVTIGSDGLGLITFIDPKGLFPTVAHCENVACSTATVTAVDTSNFRNGSSVTIGADGLGLMSYEASSHLKVAHCSNLACTSFTNATLDTDFDVGGWSSITTGSDGLGLISYHDRDNGSLKVAHCSNLAVRRRPRRRSTRATPAGSRRSRSAPTASASSATRPLRRHPVPLRDRPLLEHRLLRSDDDDARS